MTRLGRSTLLLNSKAPEQMTAEYWRWCPKWNQQVETPWLWTTTWTELHTSKIVHSLQLIHYTKKVYAAFGAL